LSFEQLKNVDIDACNNTKHHGQCQLCPMAKMHRSGFPLSSSRAQHCFDLLPYICSPYHHNTGDGAKFFISIMDDYLRATWVHLIAHKSNAFP